MPNLREAQDWTWLGRLLDSQPDLRRRLGVSLEWENPSSPVLRVTDKVGYVEFKTPNKSAQLRVSIRPKVTGSVGAMLAAVLRLPLKETRLYRELSASSYSIPSIWLAAVYVDELEKFLALLRTRGEEIDEELVGRIKGQLLLEQYVQRNFLTRRHIVPCRYMEWTVDNLPNRILRNALLLSQRLLGRFSTEMAHILGIARRCDSALGEVRLVRVLRDDLSVVRSLLQGSFRHYAEIVRLASLLIRIVDPFTFGEGAPEVVPVIETIDVGSTDDGTVKWDLVSMPALFEEYVRLITRAPAGRQKAFDVPLCGYLSPWIKLLQAKTIVLDRPPIAQAGGLCRIVLDAKYKLVGRSPTAATPYVSHEGILHLGENQAYRLSSGEGISGTSSDAHQMANADLFQVIAYATHRELRASVAALVYPVARDQGESGLAHYSGLGFARGDSMQSKGIPVYILTARIDKEGVSLEVDGKGLLRNVLQILRDNSHAAATTDARSRDFRSVEWQASEQPAF